MRQSFILIILLVSKSLQAQPFLSIKGTTEGAGTSIGYLESVSGIGITAGYNIPVLKTSLPAILYISMGKQFLLSHREKDNLSLTLSIGYAHYSVKDFSNYDKDYEHGEIIQIKKVKPIYGLELGKDWYLGRLFLSADYCGGAIFGAGVKGYFR
ncbi:MAG: hypothetical protein ABI707_06735 [Ferruginibacter sp.]